MKRLGIEATLLLGLLALLGGAGCNKPAEVSARGTPEPAAPPAPIVGQWRNMQGTWHFEAKTFWFNGGTTIQTFPGTGVTTSRSKVLSGTYQAHGTNLHLMLKQRTPDVQESTFQIDGQQLTIDGEVYKKQ